MAKQKKDLLHRMKETVFGGLTGRAEEKLRGRAAQLAEKEAAALRSSKEDKEKVRKQTDKMLRRKRK